MKLETEFRLCLQRQKLEWLFQDTCEELTWQSSAIAPREELAPSTWVKLRQPPNPFASDEALLLCQTSDHQWLAWVPDYGELVIDVEELR